MRKLINFFKESYRRDPVATYVEAIETVILISASATLAFTVLEPATHIFVPLYLVGSILAMISTWRRGSTAFALTAWFTLMNTIALTQLIWNAL